MAGWRRTVTGAGLAWTAAVAAAMPPVSAAEWTLTPSLTGTAGYNDNIRVVAEDQDDTFFGSGIANLTLRRRTPRFETELAARGQYTAYTEDEAFNSDEARITLQATYAMPVSALGARLDWNRDSNLVTIDDVRGATREATHITTTTAGTSYQRRLSERDGIVLAAEYLTREFEEADRVDFEAYGIDASWTRALSQIWSGTVTLSANVFDPEGITNSDSTSYALLVGLVYEPSERTRLSVSAGPELTERRPRLPVFPETQETTYAISLSGRYELDELTSLTGTLSRRTEGGGGGTAITRDRIALALTHRWSERLRLRLSASYLRSEREELGLLETRDVLAFDAGLNYQLDRDLDFGLTYGLRSQTFEGGGDEVLTNTLRLTLTHRLPALRWSE